MYDYKVYRALKPRPFVKKNIRITMIMIVAIIMMLWLPWQQTVKGVGTLTAFNPAERNYKIVATIDGFIDTVDVEENQFVKQGQRLFSMKDLDSTYGQRLKGILNEYHNTLENTNESYLNIENNIVQQKNSIRIGMEVYDTKLIQLQNRLKAHKQQQKALVNQHEIEKINYKRAQRLFKDGIESKRDLELKKFTALKTEAKAKKISIDIENIYNEIDITKKEKARFGNESELKLNSIQNKLLSMQSSKNKLQQQIDKNSVTLSRYQSKESIAKSDGYVMRVYQSDQNKLLKKGDEVLYFAPKVNERSILLKVPIFNMPLIKEGLTVRIMFYGWPALYISGWPMISHSTYGGIIKSIEHTSHEKGAYYAVVVEDKDDDPWPDDKYLRMGTEASVWVRLQTVPVWYELWRMLAAQPPKMINLSEDK